MLAQFLERQAPSITDRANVQQPILTGFITLDTLIPLGRGQRELIVGDRRTGKSFLAQAICLNQKRNNRFLNPDGFGRDRIFCVYACIGLRAIDVRKLLYFVQKNGISWYTSVYSATAGQSCVRQYMVAFLACDAGEGFRDHGFNALVVYDSLSNHAVAHRQQSLALRLTPGREAYPANTFYTHAKLLERAAQLSKRLGFGSLTALPIVETQANNLTAFIPTNLISITDGQIFLSKDLARHRIYPAIDIFKSVSRVGARAQPFLIKYASSLVQSHLLAYHQFAELRLAGATIPVTSEAAYKKSVCFFNLIQQREPRFFEENLIIILAADLGILCYKTTSVSIAQLLPQLYTSKNRWLLWLLVSFKYCNENQCNTRALINLIIAKLTTIRLF